MALPRLSDDELAELFGRSDAPAWEIENECLVTTIRCDGFTGSLEFVGAVGKLAQAADHHPDIDIRYDRVRLALVTHESGGITELDFDLARQIDRVAGRFDLRGNAAG